ncbi:MAG: hypothetical protein ACTHOM_11525, partial [Allomuricauda sp.]
LTLSGDPTATPIDLSVYSDNTTLASTNLTQTDANRSYDIGVGGTLNFTNGNVGAGTTGVPTSTLQTGGSFASAIDNLSGSIDLTSIDIQTIIVTGNSTIILPAPGDAIGRIYIVKVPDTDTNDVPDFNVNLNTQSFLDSSGNSQTVFGPRITKLQSDGANWQQIN